MRSNIGRLSSKSSIGRRYLILPIDKRISTRKPGDLSLLSQELKPQIDTSREYSAQDAMKLLGLSEPAIQGYCKKGILKAQRRGKKPQWFISGQSIQDAVAKDARIVPLTEATRILREGGHKISRARLLHFANKRGMLRKSSTTVKGIDFFDLNRLRHEFSMSENSLDIKNAAKKIGIERGWADPLIRRGLIHTVTVRGLKRVPNYEARRILEQKNRQVSFKEAIAALVGLNLPRFGYHAAWDAIHRAKLIEKGITGAKSVDKQKLESLKQDILRKRRLRVEKQQIRQKLKEEKTQKFKELIETRRREKTAEKKLLLARANIQPGDPRYDFISGNHQISVWRLKQNINFIQELTGSTNLRGFADYLWRSKKYIRKYLKRLNAGLEKRDELERVNNLALATPVDGKVIKIAQTGQKLSSTQLMNLIILCKQQKPGAFEGMVAQWDRRIRILASKVPHIYDSVPFEQRVQFGAIGLNRAIRTYARIGTENMAFATYANKAIFGEIRSQCRAELGLPRKGSSKMLNMSDLTEAQRIKLGYE